MTMRISHMSVCIAPRVELLARIVDEAAHHLARDGRDEDVEIGCLVQTLIHWRHAVLEGERAHLVGELLGLRLEF